MRWRRWLMNKLVSWVSAPYRAYIQHLRNQAKAIVARENEDFCRRLIQGRVLPPKEVEMPTPAPCICLD